MAIDSYIQMKLYTLTKRQFLFLFLSFFVFFLVSIFVGECTDGGTILKVKMSLKLLIQISLFNST